MKREYKINSTSEVLVANRHQENHRQLLLFFGLMQNPSTKWKAFLYCLSFCILKAQCLRKTFTLQNLGTLKENVAPYLEEQDMKFR